MSHTPGPWSIGGKQSIRGPNGEYIAKTNWANGEANAILIAATPDLLAALQNLLTLCKEYEQSAALEYGGNISPPPEEFVAAEAAIAKATGEPTC